MIIAIGCDHAGYPLKEAVKEKLIAEGAGNCDLRVRYWNFHRLQQGEGHSLCAVHFRGDGRDVPETQQCQRNRHGRSDDLSGAGF